MPTSSRAAAIASTALLVLLSGWVLLVASLSLAWRMQLDTPLLHYMGFLVSEHGFAPYRDVYVTSFPGAILLHAGILEVFGHGDRAFQVCNLVWLTALGATTFGALRAFGARTALGGGVLFATLYFDEGASMVLQRDVVLLLPIAGALWVHAAARGSARARAFWIGLLFALAGTIKPHAMIGLPLVLFAEWLALRDTGSSPASIPVPLVSRAHGRTLSFAVLGAALPAVLVMGWVASTGGLDAFLSMVGEYLPLHVRLSRTHRYLEDGERLTDTLNWALQFGRGIYKPGAGQPAWLLAAAVGSYATLASGGLDRRRRRLVGLLIALAAAYFVYVVLAGQFWGYHWMPFRYFVALLAALSLAPLPEASRHPLLALHPPAALLLAIALVLPISGETFTQLSGAPLAPPDQGRVDEIASFLDERLEPGDTVQPLDWARGGVHAALVARAPIATPFVSDYHFWHHVDVPYVQELRRSFAEELAAAPPRFVLEMRDRPMPSGSRTTREFPELEALLAQRYRIALERSEPGQDWAVWERVD